MGTLTGSVFYLPSSRCFYRLLKGNPSTADLAPVMGRSGASRNFPLFFEAGTGQGSVRINVNLGTTHQTIDGLGAPDRPTLGAERAALNGGYDDDGTVAQPDLDLILSLPGATSLPSGFNTSALAGRIFDGLSTRMRSTRCWTIAAKPKRPSSPSRSH